VRHRSQQVAHDVHAAPVPGCAETTVSSSLQIRDTSDFDIPSEAAG
jgi:hypothetical protein